MPQTDVINIRKNRIQTGVTGASKAISEILLEDILAKIEFFEALIRSNGVVEAEVASISGTDIIKTQNVTSGKFSDAKVGHTLEFIEIGIQQEKERIQILDIIGTGATPDIQVDRDITGFGLNAGDKFIIIFGLPQSIKGHTHTGRDSTKVAGKDLVTHLLFEGLSS